MVSQKHGEQEYPQSEQVNNDLIEETGNGMINNLFPISQTSGFGAGHLPQFAQKGESIQGGETDVA